MLCDLSKYLLIETIIDCNKICTECFTVICPCLCLTGLDTGCYTQSAENLGQDHLTREQIKVRKISSNRQHIL